MSTVHHQEYLNIVYATGICHSSSVGVCYQISTYCFHLQFYSEDGVTKILVPVDKHLLD